MYQDESTEVITHIQRDPSKIRNFCMLAHVDHGKTTLSDVLVASNGVISTASAGKVRFLDSRPDEQERLITMKASTIALRHRYQNTNHVLNLIDSPGHVDFSCEVSTAVRLSDGAFLLVDAIDGVAPQTRAVLEQAYREKVKCCLVINKIDLLLQMCDPADAYLTLAQIIQQVNVLMAEFVRNDEMTRQELVVTADGDAEGENAFEDDEEVEEDGWFEAAKGNVIFASAIDGWGFTPANFATIYAKKLGWSEKALTKALWGQWYLDQKKKKIVRNPPRPDAQPMCVKFVLEQIAKVYKTADTTDDAARGDQLMKICGTLGLEVREQVLRKKDARNGVAAVMAAWLPLARCVLDTGVLHLPSPVQAQAYRMRRLVPDLPLVPADDQGPLRAALTECNASPDAPVLANVAKMLDVEQLPGHALQSMDVEVQSEEQVATKAFVGVARIFAGRIRKGDTLYILDPKHKPGQEDTVKEFTVRQLFLLMGRGLAMVDEVSAGSIFGIGGLGGLVLKSGTLASRPSYCGFSQMVFQSAAVIHTSVEPADAGDLARLKQGLALLNKADPQVEVTLTEQGELVISTAGEVHAERCIRDLEDRYAQGVAMKVSEPLVSFRETIVTEQKKPTAGTTANKQCTFTVKAYNVPEDVADFLDQHQEALQLVAGLGKAPVETLPEEAVDCMKALRDVLFETDGGSKWSELWGTGLWSLGPRNGLTCILASLDADVQRDMISTWNRVALHIDAVCPREGGDVSPSRRVHQDPTRSPKHDAAGDDGEPPPAQSPKAIERRVVRQLNDSIIAGFQMAVEKGPLCDEPMTKVAFFVESLEVGEETQAGACYGPLSGQVMSTINQACRQAFMQEGKRLVEPVYECDVLAADNCHGKVFDVLKRRRADVIDNIPQDGRMGFRVIAHLPVTESFGLADELRIKTSGHATPNLRFSHWGTIDTDPFFVRRTEEELEDLDETDVAGLQNIPRTLINKVRKRKGMAVEEMAVQRAEKMKKYSTRGG
eukprot:TRINITY_DN32230_c0_g1_i1.p1 TRINITY_DN32230_c0_g1~~TRINITY_DN32230_c0_g1_i1.p1  ORF type:complete len:1001 (+),score=444.09 TRINITY_DN32230_c0_g1_i1:62-3064(+)